MRGIESGKAPILWEGHGDRLKFPDMILETSLIPSDWNYIFVPPGTKQEISFITRIDKRYQFLVAHAEFSYDRFTPHNVERMFEIQAS